MQLIWLIFTSEEINIQYPVYDIRKNGFMLCQFDNWDRNHTKKNILKKSRVMIIQNINQRRCWLKYLKS